MSDVSVYLLVAVFEEEELAYQALEILKQTQKKHSITLDNVALLHKDTQGRLHIKETVDMGGGKGAALGGVAEAAIGLISGSALYAPDSVGDLVDALSARLRDSGFSDTRLKKLGEEMPTRSTAILVVLEHRWMAEVENAMVEAGADLFSETLSVEVAGQLEAGHKMAYSALVAGQSLPSPQVIGEENDVGSHLLIGENSSFGEQFVATERGFAIVPIYSAEASLIEAGLPSTTMGVGDERFGSHQSIQSDHAG